MAVITGNMLRDAFISGVNNLDNHKTQVDELNVFPVPDGDTGTNMTMTVSNAVEELSKLDDGAPVGVVAKAISGGCLRGARGNSGVILSLLFRGFSRAMKDHTDADSECLALALEKGVGYAYKAVMKPSEGTILTVARRASEEVSKKVSELDPTDLFDIAVTTAEEALEKTPEQLETLKRAGVVDAGGQGLVYIYRGMQSVFKGGEIIRSNDDAEADENTSEAIDSGLKDKYIVDFDLLDSNVQSVEAIKAAAEAFGENVSFEGKDRIHFHAESSSPDAIISKAFKQGRLSNVSIKNMYEYMLEKRRNSDTDSKKVAYAEPIQDADIAVVAVSDGKGIDQMFMDLGATAIVNGGQTMNPSTEDILAGIESVPSARVLVLANNKNIIMAAEAACGLADRTALTVSTRSIPQGLSAMLSFDPSISLDENRDLMMEAASKVVTGQVTYAVRDSEFAGKPIKQGSVLCLIDGKIAFTSRAIDKSVVRLAKKICGKDSSLLTVIYGNQVTPEDAEKVAEELRKSLPATVEVELIDGGQPVYYYYLSAE